MNLKEVLARLQAYGTAQNRKVYARHGAGDKRYGVSFTNQKKLKKEIGVDQALCRGLWATENFDARVLAMMIADPEATTKAELNRWIAETDNYVLADAVAGVASQTKHAVELMREWQTAKDEWTSAAGWTTLSHCLAHEMSFERTVLLNDLRTIERTIHSRPNRTRYSMNQALISIGSLGGELQIRAVAAANRMGMVQVDHGQTGCKTPDPVSYIPKVVAHRKAKGETARRKKA